MKLILTFIVRFDGVMVYNWLIFDAIGVKFHMHL